MSPKALLDMSAEELQTEEEQAVEREKVERVVMGPRIVLSQALFDDDDDDDDDVGRAAAAAGGGGGHKCVACGSKRVLMSRRQSYNEQSTWCGEDKGASMMINCLACGKLDSQREEEQE